MGFSTGNRERKARRPKAHYQSGFASGKDNEGYQGEKLCEGGKTLIRVRTEEGGQGKARVEADSQEVKRSTNSEGKGVHRGEKKKGGLKGHSTDPVL